MIDLDKIWFRYEHSDWVLKGLSAKIRPGFNALVGANGAGKSTLLKIIIGALKPMSGKVTVENRIIHSISDALGIISYVPTNARSFIIGPTVETDFEKAIKFAKKDLAILDDLMEHEIIKAIKAKKIFHLSEGEARITAIISAYLLGTKVLLLDEPTIGLDKKYREFLMSIFEKIKRDTIILVASNDLRLVACADELLFLHEGTIKRQGTPKEVLYDPLFIKVIGQSDIVAFIHQVQKTIQIKKVATPVELSALLKELVQGD